MAVMRKDGKPDGRSTRWEDYRKIKETEAEQKARLEAQQAEERDREIENRLNRNRELHPRRSRVSTNPETFTTAGSFFVESPPRQRSVGVSLRIDEHISRTAQEEVYGHDGRPWKTMSDLYRSALYAGLRVIFEAAGNVSASRTAEAFLAEAGEAARRAEVVTLTKAVEKGIQGVVDLVQGGDLVGAHGVIERWAASARKVGDDYWKDRIYRLFLDPKLDEIWGELGWDPVKELP